ncbi:ROK family glucokinase [Pontibacillus marinus]|uniref:Glucokinase n=1 Tax=Pontibacillus marinus BH030004 = DSM 16465 TaxID=1385511 RepID=A0A0A5HN48_9BACI|nr:ROK family glucokinase [Pontibacillus marinus]KGX85017.1 glucokinase [Pontibacillus marinus BH030004 = DSM 16465]
MENRNFIGVDIGGTTVKLAFITYNGDILSKWEIPTNKEGNGSSIVEDIAASIKSKQEELNFSHDQFIGIGVGAPGFVDVGEGFIYSAVNIGWENYHLTTALTEETGYDAWLENDANLAALGENWKGAGGQANHLIAVTLGTGVGGGIIGNGQLLHGANGTVAEIGHMTAKTENGRACNCGKTGCLETVASATAIVRSAYDAIEAGEKTTLQEILRQNETISARDVFQEAAKGDQASQSILDEVIHYLGIAIANLAIAINPTRIVIGGGVSQAGDQLLNPLRKVFDQNALKRTSQAAEFVIASLGNDAGVLGAAYLAKQKSGK